MNSLIFTTLDIERDLFNSIAAEAEIIILDSTENIQERITEILVNYSDLSNVHFVLSKRDGERSNTELDRLIEKGLEIDRDRLSSFLQKQSSLGLRQSFAEDATILFHEFNPQTKTFDTLQELGLEARHVSLKPDELNNSLDIKLVLEDSNELDDATVTTDLNDYPPGSTAVITGENFDPGETIELQVLHTDDIPNTGGGHEPWQVTDGGAGDLDGKVNGNFETTWYVNPDDSADSAFKLTATGLTSRETATHHFTDSGSDFSIDFAAAAPQIYNHDTGGGAFEDKTINLDAVESLEGGDFAVGEIVSYYFNVTTASNAIDQFPQTIEIDVSFLVNTTGATGVSHRDIVGVSANYYTGELSVYDDPTSAVQIISDSGAIDDDSSTAWIVPGSKIYENKVTGEGICSVNRGRKKKSECRLVHTGL